jgi:hypothetical protein
LVRMCHNRAMQSCCNPSSYGVRFHSVVRQLPRRVWSRASPAGCVRCSAAAGQSRCARFFHGARWPQPDPNKAVRPLLGWSTAVWPARTMRGDASAAEAQSLPGRAMRLDQYMSMSASRWPGRWARGHPWRWPVDGRRGPPTSTAGRRDVPDSGVGPTCD